MIEQNVNEVLITWPQIAGATTHSQHTSTEPMDLGYIPGSKISTRKKEMFTVQDKKQLRVKNTLSHRKHVHELCMLQAAK